MLDAIRHLRRPAEPEPSDTDGEVIALADTYIRAGRIGLALATVRNLRIGARPEAIAYLSELPDPSLPHVFRPRRYGSRKACEVCGARRDDKIHINQQERRRDG